MAINVDYIPSRHNEFNDWQLNMVARVTASAVAWGIAAGKVTDLTAQQTVYQPFYDAIANPNDRTKAKNGDHKTARGVYESYLRAFVKENLRYNTVITTGEKELLGINPGTNTASGRPPILTAPHLIVNCLGNQVMEFECRVDGDSNRPSIHPHADAVELVGSIGLIAPASYQDTIKIGISSKAHFKHIHDNPFDLGKNIYAFARWLNITDPTKNGPWSEYAYTMIS